ncbi:unnamed protein product, partial [Coregonus sp. 'balchen']
SPGALADGRLQTQETITVTGDDHSHRRRSQSQETITVTGDYHSHRRLLKRTMERLQYYHCLLSYLLLALRDPALCAKEITVTPAKPIVKLGDAVTLTCETTCPQGRPRWKELDESDATVNTTENRSDLNLADVQPNHEGKYTCIAAKCITQKKETIQLRVYSLPVPVLSTVPENPVSGQPFEVKCTLTKVFHRDCDHFEMHLFHREKIEAELSKNCDDGRFCDYTQSSKDQMGTGNTDYQCEAKLTIGPQTFVEKAFLTIHFQDDADGDDDDPRSTVMSLTTLSVGPVETQTTEPVNKEGEGQDDADGDDDDPRSTVMSLTTLSVGPVETQTSEPVNKEGEGQDDADEDDDDPRSIVMSPVEASSAITTAMAALGSTVGSLASLCFLGFLARLIKQRKRNSPPSGPENHPDGC